MNGQSSSYTVPLYDTTALTSALSNPYAQHYAPHYYHAYFQSYSNGPPRTTIDGYTLSSTYVPGRHNETSRTPFLLPALEPPSARTHSQSTVKPIANRLTHGTWYQPGNCRCTRQGCPFSGSPKSVEIHMMDRHFIFPPGWEKRDDWDTDPSLRGKPITIQGTSVVLDTPQAINDWIAERKRRFPTDAKVREKKRKLEEAAALGQLIPGDIGTNARKKHRKNTTVAKNGSKEPRRQGYQNNGGRQWQGLSLLGGSRTQATDNSTAQGACEKANCTQEPPSDSGSPNEAPEVVSSKAPPLPVYIPGIHGGYDGAMRKTRMRHQECVRGMSLPKRPPPNPFASRSTLLRNLLLPEIQVTVSNLSQAIHFLVSNDFLRDVELRPGEARERMIEVLEPRETLRSQLPIAEFLDGN